jgi:threonine dehydratase
MAASVGAQAVIIAPRTAPPAKVAQLLTFGARVVLVDGSYDQAFDLSIEASRELGGTIATQVTTPTLWKAKRRLGWKSGSRCCTNVPNPRKI